ncbi:flagellin lysine-N-methylase [Selenomonas ruminantium]|uniref:flagellin lysine-N-methylase n=1 Tax=Selenomonas ruminantium TaxID=971 RepID=UPI0026F1116E|nr:flagellin lysine-N-methylase [Selenomonas ruminantium]
MPKSMGIGFDFIDDFVCDGFYCNSRCCREWRIDIDKSTWKRYKKLKDKTLRVEIKAKTKYLENMRSYAFYICEKEDYRCPFLEEDKLCRIQKKMGEEYIPDICATYPRTYVQYPTHRADNLLLSCPLAGKLLLSQNNLLQLSEKGRKPKRNSMVNVSAWYSVVMNYMLVIQKAGIAILQNKQLNIRQRLFSLFVFGDGLQSLFAKEDQDVHAYIKKFNEEQQVEIGRMADNFSTINSKFLKDFFGVVDEVLSSRQGIISAREEQYAQKLVNFYGLTDGNSIERICELYREAQAAWQKYIAMKFPYFTENYLVYQFFGTRQPVAVQGSIIQNMSAFLIYFRIWQMFMMVLAATEKDDLTEYQVVECMGYVTKLIEHDHNCSQVLFTYVGKSQISMFDFLRIWLPD